eukprot:TRINITY_DN50949_c0_g3_i1.p1 TRINITY_DN50949_c0_g3~~TRINITY_DN50949_c0_g3_i1.p1  ORF type:complete len:772 (+),score=197.90 TRINITY_DN50949_c0_g3_i1:1880-4195(+)
MAASAPPPPPPPPAAGAPPIGAGDAAMKGLLSMQNQPAQGARAAMTAQQAPPPPPPSGYGAPPPPPAAHNAVHQPLLAPVRGAQLALDAGGLAAAAMTGDAQQIEGLVYRIVASINCRVVDATRLRKLSLDTLVEARRLNCDPVRLKPTYTDLVMQLNTQAQHPGGYIAALNDGLPGAVPVQQGQAELERLEARCEAVFQGLQRGQLMPAQAKIELAQVEAAAHHIEYHEPGGALSGFIMEGEQRRQLFERLARLFSRTEQLLAHVQKLEGSVQGVLVSEPLLGVGGTYEACQAPETPEALRRMILIERLKIEELEEAAFASQKRLLLKQGEIGLAENLEKRPSILQGRGDFMQMPLSSLKAELGFCQALRHRLREEAEARLFELGGGAAGGHLPQGEQLLGAEADHGLRWERQWLGKPGGPPTEEHRHRTRDGTKHKVASKLGMLRFGDPAAKCTKYPPNCADTTLLLDQSPWSRHGAHAAAGGKNLLGRYDLICVRARADFGQDWKILKDQGERDFWVIHAAAINIGESMRAADFPDFTRVDGGVGLDDRRYIDSMGHIFDNIVQACGMLRVASGPGVLPPIGIEHLVLFPFGLGAFLRKLPLLDHRFESRQQMVRLRRGVVARLAQALSKLHPSIRLHVCISTSSQEEAKQITDAFIRAFMGAGGVLKSQATMYPDADALQLAHDLAGSSRGVALLNGANRQLLGNHWFAGQAQRAIDENLHRRSWTLSALSYMLNDFNDGHDPTDRPPTMLQQTVQRLGGQAYGVGT